MTDDMHPEVAAVLREAERLQSAMDDQLAKMSTQTFVATDETETVEVTLNGHQLLTDVLIEDGLLRLGAATVESRVNEALRKASVLAAESLAVDQERIDAILAEITADPDGQT